VFLIKSEAIHQLPVMPLTFILQRILYGFKLSILF
jgi:hypothetical protein